MAKLARQKRDEIKGQAAKRDDLAAYRLNPEGYIRDRLGWEPWSGTDNQPGQAEVIDAYRSALAKQLERRDYEAGLIKEDDLKDYVPGEIIQYRIRVKAGHTVGKTKLAAGLVSHFFDTCPPAIVYTFAPTAKQVNLLLWKEIRADREGKPLPGRVLDAEPRMVVSGNHFAIGQATTDAGGKGTERVHGQHGPFLMFVLDEAEGIADFVWSAIDSMASGGVVIVLMLANPRTRTSSFHRAGSLATVKSFRISCLWHPNVIQGREVVPGAVRREYVEEMIAKHCEAVAAHAEDDYTFEVPWRPGVIYKPNAEFLFRVLGEAPKAFTDKTLISPARYEHATRRVVEVEAGVTEASLGIDCARWGSDQGTIYTRWGSVAYRVAKLSQVDTWGYFDAVDKEITRLAAAGVTRVSVRVDGGGGFGSGIIDTIKATEWVKPGPDGEDVTLEVVVFEVEFGGTAHDKAAYADTATELYGEAAETLKGVSILDPAIELEDDLTGRLYEWINKSGRAVKKLEPKEKFRDRLKRSPDDGDGLVLALAPDHVFGGGLYYA